MSFADQYRKAPDQSRPKIRWWLPGIMVDEKELVSEIQSMKEAGFAGAEISPSEYYHPDMKAMQMGWGYERWYQILRRILEEAHKQDFEIDLSVSSSAPIALPTIHDVNDPVQGAQMELNGAHIDGITRKNPYIGPLPVNQEAVSDIARVNGRAHLYAVTVAKYADKERKILSYDSVAVLDPEKHVRKAEGDDFSYQVEFIPQEDGEYVLFAWWLHPSGEQVCGMLQIDHYAKAGIEKTIEFYEKHVFPVLGEAKKYITSLFVDSLEYRIHLDATWDMREQFIQRYGYDYAGYLPAVYDQNRYFLFEAFNYNFSFDQHNEQLIRNHGEFLTDLYIENHLKPLASFCEKHGLTLRYQTAYGKFMELARTAGYVHIPETETLYGKDIIDFYRMQAGSVHIKNRPIYSVEASAERPGRGNGEENSGNYAQTYKNHLWHLQRAYAGGVNQVYFHGRRYRGQYHGAGNQNGVIPDILWPGYECQGYLGGWSNSWDERQPNWKGIRTLTDFLARTQFVLQQGTPWVDLAVYQQSYWETIDEEGAEKHLNTSALEYAGYTYDFISPAHLMEKDLDCDGQHLFVKGPRYKALILENIRCITIECIHKLIELADLGFPVIFCGFIPEEIVLPGTFDIKEILEELLQKDSVYRCEDPEQLPEILERIHVYPDADFEKSVKVLSVHRHTDEQEFYYLYHYADADSYPELNEKNRVSFKVCLKGKGKPYIMDAWTGQIIHADVYGETDEGIIVEVTIAEGDSCTVLLDSSGTVLADVKEEPDYERAEPIRNWTFQLESWKEGKSPVDTCKESFCDIMMEDPLPWTCLKDYEEVSGSGVYRTEFQWDSKSRGGYLLMEKVEDCYQVAVNGNIVPADQIHPLVDIGPWLRHGNNVIEIEVCSTLLNAVIRNRKNQNMKTTQRYEETGLTGPVWWIPYQ